MNSVLTANEACVHSVQQLHNCIPITIALLNYICMQTSMPFCPTFIIIFPLGCFLESQKSAL